MNLTFQDWRYQLLNACDQGNLLEVQKLLIPTVIAPLTLNIDTHRYAMLRETYFLAFRIACEKGHLDLIEDFIHRTPLNVNAPWQKLLPHDFFQGWLFACHGGSLNALHHLISHPVSRDNLQGFPLMSEKHHGLHYACEKGHLDVVKYLLTSTSLKDCGYSFDTHHLQQGFFRACQTGQLDVVKYLLTSSDLKQTTAGLDFLKSPPYENALLKACQHAQWPIVRWLVIDHQLAQTPIMHDIIQDYPQAADFFKSREEQHILTQTLQPDLPSSSLAPQSSVMDERFSHAVKVIYSAWTRLLSQTKLHGKDFKPSPLIEVTHKDHLPKSTSTKPKRL